MRSRIFILTILLFSSIFSFSVHADDGYIGEDLWNDIYRRLDEGVYRLKKQLIESRLKDSTLLLNGIIEESCTSKKWEKIFCLRDGVDFTAMELDEIVGGGVGSIYTHLNPENSGVMDTELLTRIRSIIVKYYQTLQTNVSDEQKKLQTMGSIGLFTDGNKDNSSYDLMVDLENIHSVLFAHDIPYNGTENMGASSLANLLGNAYDHPFSMLSPLDNLIASPVKDPWVSVISPGTSSELTLSWLLSAGSGCAPVEGSPLKNLDPDFLRDVQSQLLVGTNPNSSLAFGDDGKLPEYWAKVAKNSGGSSGSAGAGTDSFPCSGTDFFCIMVSMTTYTQNLLAGGKAATIEKILDENLKIANTFAPASGVQSKMTKLYFGLDLVGLDLPSMLHIGVVFSQLPPPLLNLKPPTSGSTGWDTKGTGSAGDEFNKILVGTFEQAWLDYKDQNRIEKDNEARMVGNLPYLTTDSLSEKSDLSKSPVKSSYISAKEMELKKSYGDSFNADLFELHDFTVAFTENLKAITSAIKLMDAIPQK